MKTLIILIADMFSVLFAFALAWLFHINFDLTVFVPSSHAVVIGLVSLSAYIFSFFLFSIPKVVWRYVSIKELIRLSCSVVIGLILSLSMTTLLFGFTITSSFRNHHKITCHFRVSDGQWPTCFQLLTKEWKNTTC